MRVLLTGGTGFLGSWVERALIAAGHELRALVRPKPDGPRATRYGAECVSGDLLDPDSLERAANGVDAIVHVAGMVSLRARDRDEVERVNVLGTRHLLELASRRGLRMLHTSTIGTLGYDVAPVLRDERSVMPHDQAAAFAYLGSKLRAERLVLEAAGAGTDVAILSPAVLFGPGDGYLTSTRPVLSHLRGTRFCLSGGSGFADVRDVAAVYVSALERARPGRRYLLSSMNLTYVALFSQLSWLTGLPAASPVATWMAQTWGTWSELATRLSAHPFEEINSVSVQCGTMFNFVDGRTAVRELGYAPREFRATLLDTITDHLQRGLARATTPALERLTLRGIELSEQALRVS